MKLIICICTYNRNSNLHGCLKSINKLRLGLNVQIKIIIVDNSIKNNSFKLVKKIKKSFKYKIIQLHEKRKGVVYARNKCLKALKKINPKYICFFDDDCVVDRSWFKNAFRAMKFNNADVITGPLLPLIKRSLRKKETFNYPKIFERNFNENNKSVRWAATNNVLLKYSIVKKNNLIFDKNLNRIGYGEDQLFFLTLNKKGYQIYWVKNVKVYENIDSQRLNFNWLIMRSFKVGIVGYYIDQVIYGRFIGLVINYFKSLYYFIRAISFVLLFFNRKFRIKILNYFSRFYGRLVGPLVFKR